MRSHLAISAILVGSVLLAGCGGASPKMAKETATPGPRPAAAGAANAPPAAAVNGVPTPVERKIIFTGALDIVVASMDDAVPRVEKLVAAQKGYIAKSEVREDTGSRRTATYTLRIPVESFQGTREGLLTLGIAERNSVDSQDVTEEFVDVQARIKNLKEQEDKLNELLKEKRKEEKLDDVIKVSDRIAAVRGDVERAQGRLNYLANMSAMATINLALHEVKDYKPPTTPTFGNRINDTFDHSLNLLTQFGEGVVLFFVGITPWLIVLVPLGLVGYVVVRKTKKAPTPGAPSTPSPPAPPTPTA